MTMRSLQEPSMANFEVVVYGITIGDQQIGAFNAPVGAASCVGIIGT